MANNMLQTVIQLRYGTYSQWMNSSIILKLGEAAICAFPDDRAVDILSNTTPSNTPPAVGIKIGDGHSYFYQLPWVQGVAADVYTWAKASVKPTYTASEISGLTSFIEDNFHISGDITIAPRIYQIVAGTDDNINKYFLRYKESNENAQWIIDTNNPIDLTAYAKVAEWIGVMVDRFPTIGTFNSAQINSMLGNLNVTDNAQTHKFVTAVSENAGLIEISREQPTFSDISGTLPVSKGGTGRQTLTEENVLVGNGTDQVAFRPIAETIANNNYLVPNNVIKAYVDNAVAGLTGAMHFIGEATVVIVNGSGVDPRINNYNFSEALPGDVILYEAKEFVWTGSSWHLLGDESSYAVKGSIKNVDVADDAEISQSKIANLSNTFNTKVDKVDGKTLTSNDFTNELKDKLNGIEEGAQRNTIEHILVNGTEVPSRTIENVANTVNLEISEFDENSQTKLANIETGAEVNKIEKIVYDGNEVTPDENRIISITSDPHTEHENKIEQIFINGIEWVPNQNKQVKIIIDQAALNLNVLEGATTPGANGARIDVTQVQKKLELESIAVSGDVKDLRQTNNTYIILNCGSSTEVI